MRGLGYGLNIVECVCFNPANTSQAGLDTKVGITSLNRAGAELDNWPMVRKSGFIALESNSKGFVVNRFSTLELENISSPQEGMMVFDTDEKCLKLYSDGEWRCFVNPTCPQLTFKFKEMKKIIISGFMLFSSLAYSQIIIGDEV